MLDPHDRGALFFLTSETHGTYSEVYSPTALPRQASGSQAVVLGITVSQFSLVEAGLAYIVLIQTLFSPYADMTL